MIKEWEDGRNLPTLITLKKLATYYKRPLAVFFLPEPPTEPSLPKDFRTMPTQKRKPLSRKSLLTIRKARYTQSVASELLDEEDIRKVKDTLIGSVTTNDEPETIAVRERQRLKISIGEQIKFKNAYDAFDRWREAMESLSILVQQVAMSPREVRGLSLLDTNMIPAIVISSQDAINARIFTLFHEYAHILLGDSGICIPEEAPHKFHIEGTSGKTENFCDNFAGTFLIPRNILVRDPDVQSNIFDINNLNRMANKYKVSSFVILRRLFDCKLVAENQYWDTLNMLKEIREKELQEIRKKKKYGISATKRCVRENGRFFISLAFDAIDRDIITYSDLSDYLSINLKHLDKLALELS